jgi:hypothetical protein
MSTYLRRREFSPDSASRAPSKGDVLTANRLGNGIHRYDGVNYEKGSWKRNFERRMLGMSVWKLYSWTSLIALRAVGSPKR